MIDRNALFALMLAPDPTPGIAAVVLRGGKIADAQAVGARVVEPSWPLAATTKMRIASLSKLPVAYGVLRLVERGKLSLDAPVDGALGYALRNPAFPDLPITARQLLTHTSGMRDGSVYWGTLGERIEDFFTPGTERWENGARFDRAHKPGAYFDYCNLAYGVLATMIERASGQRFDLYMHEHVFAPLELTCGYNWSEVPQADLVYAGALYRRKDGQWAVTIDGPTPEDRKVGPGWTKDGATLASYKPGDHGSLYSPQGGLRASIMDVAALLLQLAPTRNRGQRDLLKRKTVASMTQEAVRYAGAGGEYLQLFKVWGMGCQALPVAPFNLPGQTRTLFGHTAEAYGLVGAGWIDPVSGDGFAYLVTGGPPEDTPRPKTETGLYQVEDALMRLLAGYAFAK
jgi:CubicO group peptidase (beta-lactamase class C family)